jgi:hypothetical protein
MIISYVQRKHLHRSGKSTPFAAAWYILLVEPVFYLEADSFENASISALAGRDSSPLDSFKAVKYLQNIGWVLSKVRKVDGEAAGENELGVKHE